MIAKRRFLDEETSGMTRIPVLGFVLTTLLELADIVGSCFERRQATPARHDERGSGRQAASRQQAGRGRTPETRKQRRMGRALVKALVKTLYRLGRGAWRFVACSVRVLFYVIQRQSATFRAVRSRTRAERTFGRESLFHCANILQRRKHKLLSPGTRAARRLVRKARRALEVAVDREDIGEREAAHWLARFARFAEVDLETLDRRWWRRNDRKGQQGPSRRRRFAVAEHVAAPPRAAGRPAQPAPQPRAAAPHREEAPRRHHDDERPAPHARPAAPPQHTAAPPAPALREDEMTVVVRPVSPGEQGEPTGFNLSEEADREDEVMEYLAREREREAPDEVSAFEHSGD